MNNVLNRVRLPLIMLAAAVGCRAPLAIDVPLVYRPTMRSSHALTDLSREARIFIAPVTDVRADPKKIGQNVENATPIPVYASGEPAAFVHDTMARELRRAGMNVVDSADDADRVLKLELTSFWVDESSEYRGDVAVRVEVTEPAGQALWKGVANGTNSRFGRSYSAENYQETLTDCVVQMTERLLSNSAFQNAIRK